jgi:D-aminoacyl-tRNA deacylase
MKVVVQRVLSAHVEVENQIVGKIEQGLLIFLGISKADTEEMLDFLVEKVAHLRIFQDAEGKMNLSLVDLGLDALVVSQFTLYGNCLQGRRPDFFAAAGRERAEPFYEKFIAKLEAKLKKRVERGLFGAKMQVHLVNDGPVTLLIEHPAK